MLSLVAGGREVHDQVLRTDCIDVAVPFHDTTNSAGERAAQDQDSRY